MAIVLKIVSNFLSVACGVFLLLGFFMWATPYEQGYFENDESIKLPFKEQTISGVLLAEVGFALMVVAIIIVEVLRYCIGIGACDNLVGNILLPGWFCESYFTSMAYTFGAICQHLFCIVAKYTVGRLRPHFMDVCSPTPNEEPVLNFIKNYTCVVHDVLQDLSSSTLDSRLSFPSELSSYAMYTAVFFFCYTQVKCKCRGLELPRLACQFVVLMGAWYTGLSQYVDHMHHWSDVAAGFLIGALFAGLAFFTLESNREDPSGAQRDPEAPPPEPQTDQIGSIKMATTGL